jgi:hypothetical protein
MRFEGFLICLTFFIKKNGKGANKAFKTMFFLLVISSHIKKIIPAAFRFGVQLKWVLICTF